MDIYDKLETIMPLELWGISIGLISGMLLWLLFLILIDKLNNYK